MNTFVLVQYNTWQRKVYTYILTNIIKYENGFTGINIVNNKVKWFFSGNIKGESNSLEELVANHFVELL